MLAENCVKGHILDVFRSIVPRDTLPMNSGREKEALLTELKAFQSQWTITLAGFPNKIYECKDCRKAFIINGKLIQHLESVISRSPIHIRKIDKPLLNIRELIFPRL